jgi:hypothetical protein
MKNSFFPSFTTINFWDVLSLTEFTIPILPRVLSITSKPTINLSGFTFPISRRNLFGS